MIVVTAGTAEYRAIVDSQAWRCLEFGYKHLIYDLGGLGIGTPHAVELEDLRPTVNGDSLPPATFKAELVQKGLEQAAPGELVCWMDADCIPLRECIPLTLPFSGMWDVAVTLRPAAEVGQSNNPALDYLNSGVVWIRNNELGLRFCEDWKWQSAIAKTDQGALNHIIHAEYRAVGWNALRGHMATAVCGARVLVLDAMEWNCWHPPFAGARVAHFKRGLRSQAVNYL
jgi:hypothetical protein